VERDANGRFVKGNGGGPGRPKKEREQRYLEITLSACSFSDWRKIIKRAVADALDGDHQARSFLANYLVGPPPQRHEFVSPLNIKITEVKVNLETVDGGR
jgi:hypothetical protein